jgi:hypothetical protein
MRDAACCSGDPIGGRVDVDMDRLKYIGDVRRPP